MRRRDLLVGLLAAGGASALRAAELSRVYRLAACAGEVFTSSVWTHFFDRLRQLGYTEGKSLIVDRYVIGSQSGRFADIARDVVRAKPDAIATIIHGFVPPLAKATSTIPIVAIMGDPVAAGIVRSLARPEGNITGVAADPGMEFQGKFLDILRQAVPSASHIAYLSPRAEWEGAWGRAISDAGRQSGVYILGMPVDPPADEQQYVHAFETMKQQSADAMIANGFVPNSELLT